MIGETNSEQGSFLVRNFEANGFGLYDMTGNVWEWTCSDYNKSYNGDETKCADNLSDGWRVFRGGSWNNRAIDLRSARRNWFNPGNRTDIIGFRLARTQ